MTGSSSSLGSMLRPSTVMVVGASEEIARTGGRMLFALRRWRFSGDLRCVGRPGIATAEAAARERWFPTVQDALAAGGDVDLAILAIGDRHVPDALEELSRGGVSGAVVLANAGGGERLRTLRGVTSEVAARSGMRVIGPNSAGLVLAYAGLPASLMRRLRTEPPMRGGGLAVVTNSGGLANELMATYRLNGGAVGAWISVGAEADVSTGEVMAELADVAEISGVVTVTESMLHPHTYLRGAAALAAAGKPVYAYRLARSATASAVAALHSGTARVPGAAWKDMTSWLGVTEFDELDALADFISSMATSGPARLAGPGRAPRTAVVTPSGGAAVVATDRAGEAGVQLIREPGSRLAELLARHGLPPAFPVDTGSSTFPTTEELAAFCHDLISDDEVDLLWLQQTTALVTEADIDHLAELLEPAAEKTHKLVLISGMLRETFGRHTPRSDFVRFAPSIDVAARIIGAVERRAVNLLKAATPTGLTSGVPETAEPGQRLRPVARLSEGLDLAVSWGLRVASTQVVSADQPIPGNLEYPSVVKADSMAHKSAAGLVVTAVASPAQAELAVRYLASRGADLVVSQRMVDPGPEFLVGCYVDGDAGMVLVIGSGGTGTDRELNRQTLPAVASPAAIRLALRLVSQSNPSLALDDQGLDRLGELIAAVQRRFIARAPAVTGVELNPVIVNNEGAWVVDLRIV